MTVTKRFAQADEWIQSVLPIMSDQRFLDALTDRRGRGRNDYPIDLLWKAVLACLAYRVSSVEEMRRKMSQWPDIFSKIPSSFAFSRFFSFLCRCSSEVESLFFRKMEQLPSDFGKILAVACFDGIYFLWEPRYLRPLLFQPSQPNDAPAKIAEQLLERLSQLDGGLAARCKYLLGDFSYSGFVRSAWERFKIRAVIPAAPAEETGLQSYHEAFYDGQGVVYCMADSQRRSMIYAGFEKKRGTLKYRCMARHYGIQCEKLAVCPLRTGLRIPLSLDEKIFAPLPRASYRWRRIFSLYTTLDAMTESLRSFQQLANTDEKRLLCCRIATLLISSNQKSLE